MSRRAFLLLSYVVSTVLASSLYYIFIEWIDSMQHAALAETGDATAQTGVGGFDLYLQTLLVTAVFFAVFILVVMLFGYVYSMINCRREIETAQYECEQNDGVLFSSLAHYHWYGYAWAIIGLLPGDDEFFRSNKDNLLANLPLVRSDI